MNRYSYIANSPINFSDPLGLYNLVEKGLSTTNYIPALKVLAVATGVFYLRYANVWYLINDLLDRVVRLTEDEEAGETDETADEDLDTNTRKKIRSLEKRIAEHEQKLEDYKADPDAYDNQGILRNAPSEEIRRRIIEGRIQHLEQEIQTWRDEISRLKGS